MSRFHRALPSRLAVVLGVHIAATRQQQPAHISMPKLGSKVQCCDSVFPLNISAAFNQQRNDFQEALLSAKPQRRVVPLLSRQVRICVRACMYVRAGLCERVHARV